MDILDTPIKHLAVSVRHHMKVKFPHIPRKYSARLHIVTWTLLGILIMMTALLNICRDVTKNRTAVEQTLYVLTAYPFDPSLHEKLAKDVLPVNVEYAKNELELASYLEANSMKEKKVLGVSNIQQKVDAITDAETKLKHAITYWENIVDKVPTYVFAYQALKELYEASGEKDMAVRMDSKYHTLAPRIGK
jgi:hypothetical protein